MALMALLLLWLHPLAVHHVEAEPRLLLLEEQALVHLVVLVACTGSCSRAPRRLHRVLQQLLRLLLGVPCPALVAVVRGGRGRYCPAGQSSASGPATPLTPQPHGTAWAQRP